MTAGADNDGRVCRERYLRERAAREEAERLLEVKSRELFEANIKLEAEARRLDAAVSERTRELTEALARAEAGTKTKAQFVANMSHEIRTPLNGVLGMAQSLLLDDLPPAAREKVSVIVESGRSLTVLLNDVLDLSKIEAGRLEINASPGDLLNLVQQAGKLFEARADEKGLQLRITPAPGIPAQLSFDPVRVRQCLDNLVSNAIKFTAAGSVEISVEIVHGADAQQTARICVTDTGIGITEATRLRLFQTFTQGDNETTRRFGGTGLGLAITRQLARLMGGDVTVSSEAGVGSTFALSFLVDEVVSAHANDSNEASPASSRISQNAMRSFNVLLVDDNAINRQVIKLFLAPYGPTIREAANGKEALDLLASHPFSIVLLDVHMPVMDGRETIRRLRASPEPWRDIPVIALTADAMVGDREKFLAMGMDDYVSKPVDQRELVSRMLNLVTAGEARRSMAS